MSISRLQSLEFTNLKKYFLFELISTRLRSGCQHPTSLCRPALEAQLQIRVVTPAHRLLIQTPGNA
jgi:hypothetical protein